MRPATAEVLPGIRRITFAEVLGVGHVHCYLLRGATGWTLVDTGVGVPGAGAAWRQVVGGLDAPLERVVITHLHVDHIGAAADVAPLSAGPVLQGRLDREQAAAAYGDGAWAEALARHFLPTASRPRGVGGRGLLARARGAGQPAPTEPLDAGDRVDGWEVVALPGHADGHIGLLRDGVLVSGDALLPDISPTIGVWPGCDPDPLAAYLATLDRLVAMAPRVVLPGHGEPVADPRPRPADPRAPPRAPRPSRGRPRPGAAHGLRRVARPVAGRARPGAALVRRRRVDRPPAAAGGRGARGGVVGGRPPCLHPLCNSRRRTLPMKVTGSSSRSSSRRGTL